MEKNDDIGTWSANETIYNAGSLPEFNYLVIEGSVQIKAPNGYYLGHVGQGELFGEASFILGTKRSTTVIAGSKGLKAKFIPPKHIIQKLEKDYTNEIESSLKELQTKMQNYSADAENQTDLTNQKRQQELQGMEQNIQSF